jgi:hypothetical protein
MRMGVLDPAQDGRQTCARPVIADLLAPEKDTR